MLLPLTIINFVIAPFSVRSVSWWHGMVRVPRRVGEISANVLCLQNGHLDWLTDGYVSMSSTGGRAPTSWNLMPTRHSLFGSVFLDSFSRSALFSWLSMAFLCCVRQNQHITATLCDTLHWLPVPQRIVFKIALMAFDCVRGQGPGYFDGVMTPVHTVAAQARLWSADQGNVVILGSRTTVRSAQLLLLH